MEFKYGTQGVCSREITIDINEKDNTINSVSFLGGCNGNLKGIGALVKGQKIDDVIATLKGIDCNFKGTSCPDQLARALEDIKSEI
ncbi:MAG: TIGR03905 family TSCPD domain-containing protein [Eubacterium sp.]|nr:TIGR03905 family TSCPD domain-containing protein [Eubacterium sp.]